MIAILKVVDYVNSNACVIPVGSVQKSFDGNFVFVAVEDNGKTTAKRKTVKMGLVYNGVAEIQEGLVEGDKVITVGYQNLVEGDVVKL
jgi:multidrug efflux pump subunit AcrA (membrane-fusion protein)